MDLVVDSVVDLVVDLAEDELLVVLLDFDEVLFELEGEELSEVDLTVLLWDVDDDVLEELDELLLVLDDSDLLLPFECCGVLFDVVELSDKLGIGSWIEFGLASPVDIFSS